MRLSSLIVAAAALTPKQARFVNAYLLESNATKAYQLAYGGSQNTAAVEGHRSLRIPKIAAELAKRQAKAAARADLTLQSHLNRLNELADAAAGAEQYSAAVTAETNRGKASGFYIDRQEVKLAGKVEVRIRIEREGRRLTNS